MAGNSSDNQNFIEDYWCTLQCTNVSLSLNELRGLLVLGSLAALCH